MANIFEELISTHVEMAETALKQVIDDTIDELTGADDDDRENE